VNATNRISVPGTPVIPSAAPSFEADIRFFFAQ